MGLEVVSRASRANVLATTPIRITDRRLTLDRCLDQVSACETRHLKSSQATARSTTTSLHEFASLTPRAGYFFAS